MNELTIKRTINMPEGNTILWLGICILGGFQTMNPSTKFDHACGLHSTQSVLSVSENNLIMCNWALGSRLSTLVMILTVMLLYFLFF